jgi:hypothetical protein
VTETHVVESAVTKNAFNRQIRPKEQLKLWLLSAVNPESGCITAYASVRARA